MNLPPLDRHGWLPRAPGVTRLPSPNVDTRPAGTAVSLLVVHNITLPPGEFGRPGKASYVADLFLNRLDLDAHPWFARLAGLRVSAHFFIRRDGSIMQFASVHQRAWHAGVSRFEGRERCNDFSVGVELEGTDTLPYTDAQYATLAALARQLRTRLPIRAARGHEHIAPGRKTDPGPAFDWPRFARAAGFLRRQIPPR
ncbi:N-acetyl-anhydromuranmyl-L-alanine amidase [Bordetella trematum]|uniref:1,6-anhydro-N-acetylmuramyl-L-alanine amidase AmpD n=1 Tax=Bordetella trematum TaxID=123899 RepID=A0A157P6J0_9BORD|nr:1,6-anhydro-N-acetylmuramyl-L-alanine amidase AmpD [Bordetella trematum]AZR92686.1 N-acetyl-anhydromuranmyl-L-alanine amidase [Bordetella trematum]NNH18115.1 1,6-anhydro-N-acetylmuramyl-L-alanine amidase AmpD [Bordetella trematum]SAI28916.1 N-acetyl-anhydromuranmyl-L-alanine amidase [Bordetella trematum]SAI69092.1 N-acetyl-anhydromuranmyl-L-alanine amidase [Bordetella trematum]SUV99404.1 N-acetyl-anhydromuranmyl-L-alanine amidase [Bordetella trematum]